ncbi:unnamed protein product [Lathyrus sativus]|nr:unnamed protein product [Lathyrus sativus]
MGKKRSQIEKLPTPAAPKDDEPPTPVSKDDEKLKPSSPIFEDKVGDSSSASSSSEAAEDDEYEEDTPSKNSIPPAKPHPKTEDDSDSEDEEETDSEDEPAPKLKSLNANSKPVDQIKSKADSKPALARSGIKRPIDSDPKQAKKRKTAAEKEPEEDNKKSGDDSKRLFQRVFTEEDEMAIIKGIYDYITETGNDPFKYHTAFYEFVKKSIHFKVTLEQLRDKMRRLKQKYQKYETKAKAKSGKTPNFSKANDRIMFEFGQKIWGGKLNVNEAEEKGKPNGKLSKKEPAAKKPRTTKKLVLEPDSPLPVVKETRKVESTDTENPGSGSSLALNELIRFDESVSGSGKTLHAMKRGLELLGESKKEEFGRRWEKVQVAELEVFKMRADLAVDQAISILNALKSSSSD